MDSTMNFKVTDVLLAIEGGIMVCNSLLFFYQIWRILGVQSDIKKIIVVVKDNRSIAEQISDQVKMLEEKD